MRNATSRQGKLQIQKTTCYDARRRGKEKGEGLNGKLNSTHHIKKAQSKLMNSVEYFPAFNLKSFFSLTLLNNIYRISCY